jgi:hypothetical protein
MKKIVPALLMVVFLTSCAGTGRYSMVEDLGSSRKVNLLRKRANEFWSAFLNKDYEKVYTLYDPFFRARTNKYTFMGRMGKVKYHKFEIKDIKVEGNVAKVKVGIVYSMAAVRTKIGKTMEVPETPDEIEETWLYIYDNWYKEYFVGMVEKPVVYY